MKKITYFFVREWFLVTMVSVIALIVFLFETLR